MSVNKFMHPRNIYKTPSDFIQLAVNYPEFKAISTIKLNGKITIDFTDANAIRILTKCLLHKDFGLVVDLPQNKLVPTLPLRLNYILWIEDLINSSSLNDVRGIDIGCGASCIYPLLAVKMNSWKMVGLERDIDSLNVAQRNIDTNRLGDSIQIKSTDKHSDIFSALDENDYTFCMCNPPFYSADSTEANNRTGNRKPPKNGLTGIRNELFTEGGEVKFATQIIQSSLLVRTKIKIFTTMLGHKSSVKKLVDILISHEITNYQTTEFCQGNTTRWGLAWTFDDSVKLKGELKVASKSSKANYTITQELILSNLGYSAAIAKLEYILNILLNFEIKIIKNLEGKLKIYEIVAYDATWLNYRRRKRKLLKKSESQFENETNSTIEAVSLEPKRLKLDNAEQLLKCNVVLRNDQKNEKFRLELSYVAGTTGKNGMQQLMLFINNRFKENENDANKNI